MTDLYISWRTWGSEGEMIVHLDKFLPCPMPHFKKLLECIALDADCCRQGNNMFALWKYCSDRIKRLKEERPNAKRELSYLLKYVKIMGDAAGV